MPTEEEIRQLVAEVVDGIVGSSGSAIVGSPESAIVGSPESAPVPEKTAGSAGSGSPAVIAIGADHGGFALKERIGFKLKELGYEVHDCGTDTSEAVDYPDFAHAVARLVAAGTCDAGIIVDGAGIGSAMVANKVPGIRAALCYDLSSARNSREHNHANVLTLGAALIGEGLAWQIVQAWLATDWGEGRHARRVGKIMGVEQQYRGGEK
jgi:ribose 5-phosphate isomerase B